MADNVNYNPAGATPIATDDIGGVQHQRVKLTLGTDGVSDGDVSLTNPMPVHLELQHTVIDSSTTPLSNGASYTTPWFDAQHQGQNFTLVAVTDKAGKVEHEESLDGSTVAWSHETPYMAGESYRVHHDSFARYSRFRFTNDSGSAQSSLFFSVMQSMSAQASVAQNAYAISTSQTPLGIAGEWTSQAYDTKIGGMALTMFFVADVAATLYLEESVDGVTWDVTASAPYPGTIVFNEMHVAHANFFRVRVVNGGTGQAFMRVQVVQRFSGIPWKIKLDEYGNAVTQGSDAPWEVTGTRDNNSSVPGTALTAVAGALCRASVPTYSDGNLVLPTVTTAGDTRVTLDGETVALAAGTANIGDVDVLTLPAGTVAGGTSLPSGSNNIGDVDVATLPSGTVAGSATLPAGSNNIGDVDVLTVPADPFGVNADAIVAAGAAGSIQGKLRRATQGLEDLKSLIVLAAGTAAIGKLAANSGVDIGDVDVLTLPADPLGANADAIVAAGAVGSLSAKMRRMTQGLEDLKTLIVLGAGSAAIGKLAANSGVDIGDVDVASLTGGTIAHDAADSGNPIKTGARAVSSLATATLVAAADRSDAIADLDGAHIVKQLCPSADIKNERIADTAGTSAACTVFAAAASLRNYITTIAIFNSSATDAFVDFRDGAAGAILFTAPAPKGGGSVITFPVPLRQPTVNTALAYDVSAAITTMYISLVGFQSKA